MTDVTKASEVAERLEAKAKQHYFAARQSSLGSASLYNDAAELFDAAASLIRAQSERERVLVELLAPMAAAAKRVPAWVEDGDWFVLDGEGMDSVECKFPAGALRQALALTKAQP